MNQKVLKTMARTILLFAATVLCNVGYSQTPLKGRVVDSSGMPLVGATVTIDGTMRGDITDANGEFRFAEPENTPITVEFIGYKETKALLRDGLVVTLADDTTMIDDVVVVGYGVQKKETLTGAITVVGEEILKDKGSLASPLQAMQGQVPGVIITRSSSAPGDESWGLNMRGNVSANSAAPLVIIDGVATDAVNDIRNINPQDIESMSFLKDGAAAIYGSRAAGGVVLITTKRGQTGRAKVSYSGSFSVKTVGRTPEMMSLDQWSDAMITALENDGSYTDNWYIYARLAKAYRGQYIDLHRTANPFGGAAFTDVHDFVFDDSVNWLGSLFGNAYSTSHDVSIAGGSERITYRASFGYLYDGSSIQFGDNNNQRFNFRLNNTFKIARWLELESVVGYSRQEQVAPSNLGAVLTTQLAQPGLPLRAQNGKPYAWGTWGSPVASAEEGGNNNLSVSSINISETFKANITKWLDFNLNVGYNTSTAVRDIVIKPITYYNYAGDTVVKEGISNGTNIEASTNSSYSKTSSRTDFYSFTGYLNGHHTFKEHHNLSVTLGGQYEFKHFEKFGVKAMEIQPELNNLNGTGEITLRDVDKYQNAIASLIGRANYDYKQKYLVEFNMRYDGSSKFLPQNRWSFFWGASLGWRISQEGALKDSDWLDELKLRISYGEVGNQGSIANYDGVMLYSSNSNSGPLLGSGMSSYLSVGTLASTSRTWERIKNYNIGLDFGFLNNRLTGTFEAFMKRNDNMLVDIEFPSTLGITAPKVNAGKFKAWGYEGQLTWRDKIGKDFTYFVGGTFTFARSELVDYGGAVTKKRGYVSDREGYPLRSFFGLRYAGKIQTQEQLDAYLAKYYDNNGISMPANLRLGDNMYEDVNGDGRLDENDYVYLGSDNPEIQYSFSAGFSWKGIDVSVVFQGTGNRTVFSSNATTIPMYAKHLNSTTQSIGKVWSPENRGGYYPTYTFDSSLRGYNYIESSWSASDGSYIRLKNISVGYTLPAKLFAKTKSISGARFYFTGEDMWEHSKILDGRDPEAPSEPRETARYPFLRTFTFGVNLTF